VKGDDGLARAMSSAVEHGTVDTERRVGVDDRGEPGLSNSPRAMPRAMQFMARPARRRSPRATDVSERDGGVVGIEMADGGGMIARPDSRRRGGY
jgi:hypothetical protein